MKPPSRLPFFALACALAACSRPEGELVARVGPLGIEKDEFREKLAEVAPEYQDYVASVSGRRQFLEILVREKLILAAARDEHVASSDEFRREVEKLKDKQRREFLEFEQYLLTKLWIEGLRHKGVVEVPDDEVRDYAEKNPQEVRLQHILVADPKLGEELLKRIRQGANFAALAKEHSLDQETADHGGKLPPLLRGEVLPELEEVAFKMKVRETAGLVQSKFGWHILRKESERKVSPEEAEERVRKLLEKQKLDRYLASLQERYPVEVLDAQLK